MTLGTARARQRTGLAALAVALAGLLLGLPWLLGGSAQRAHQGLHDELLRTLPHGAILEDHYQRGWFRSRARLELALQSETGSQAPVHLRVDSRIEQGPLHWLSSGWPPALARVRSQVELSDPSLPLPPLQVITDLNAQGQGLSRLRLPAGAGPVAQGTYQLRHGELLGSLRFDPAAGSLTLRLDLPALELWHRAGPSALLQDLGLTGGLRPAAPPRGQGVDGARIESAPAAPGEAAEGGEAPGPVAARHALEGPLDLRLHLSAGALSLGQETYRRVEFEVSTEGLDGSTLGDLANVLGLLSPGASPPVRRLMGAALLAQLLPRLAATQLRISIHRARVDTPDGPLEARLNLGLDGGASDEGAGRSSLWMRALRADGEIALPETLARRWLSARDDQGARGLGGPSQPGAATLQTWIDDGWISLREGRVLSAFRLADGLLTVNGKTIPLLALPSADPW